MRPDFGTLKRKELKVIADSALLLLETATTFTDRRGYIKVTRDKNPELFQICEDLGIFEFHKDNKRKQILGVHQIVLYLRYGMYKCRYERWAIWNHSMEVHHLDSNPSNNDRFNLVYVTPQQNKLCADAVNKPYQGMRHLHSANVKAWSEFRLDGSNGLAETAKLIRLTIIRTYEALNFVVEQLPSVAAILLNLPHNVGKEVVKYWRTDSWGVPSSCHSARNTLLKPIAV